MIFISRRCLLAIAAVVDIALHARGAPVAAKALASRHDLPPRYLETVLQVLVRHGILKGTRGPRGGYALARERRRVTAGEVARAILAEQAEAMPLPQSTLVRKVVEPVLQDAGEAFLARLDDVTIEDLCREAGEGASSIQPDFTI